MPGLFGDDDDLIQEEEVKVLRFFIISLSSQFHLSIKMC